MSQSSSTGGELRDVVEAIERLRHDLRLEIEKLRKSSWTITDVEDPKPTKERKRKQ